MEGATHGAVPLQSIPQQRVVEKLDDYMGRRDYAGAERHLLYWLEEARAAGDARGELMVSNELVGHFRKTGNREQAFVHAENALRLVEELDFGKTMSAGTTYTNVATAFNAFGENDRSLELFQKAIALYEGSPHTQPQLLGGLYNNMALTCVALGRFSEADQLFDQALEIMADVENGQLEQAITHLNRADAAVAKARARCGGDEEAALLDAACEQEVECCLDTALALLDTPSVPRDGYYAFVCEKCAPTFAHYGFFLVDEDLRNRANAIYARNGKC